MTSEPGQVVVFAPNWLGDAVMALPAIADLRRHFPSARLVVAGRTSVSSLFDFVPGVDHVVTLRWRGRLFNRHALESDVATFRDLGGTSSAVAVLLPNSFGTAWLARRTGIGERWGYATDWRRPLLTRSVAPPRHSMHQGRYYQHLVETLGVPSGSLEPCMNVPEVARQKARETLIALGWDGEQPLVAMAPGAAYGAAKRWLPGHFARVIASLARDHGARTVLVGSAGDAETIQMIIVEADQQIAQPIDLAGRTSLQELASVLAVSRACVSNDSGAMHLAGAIGTPLVALFGPTREAETAPLTRATGRADVLINPVWCRPCMLRECPLDHRCMKGLEPLRVISALEAMGVGRPGRPGSTQRTRQRVDA